jgi:hypothetical protein
LNSKVGRACFILLGSRLIWTAFTALLLPDVRPPDHQNTAYLEAFSARTTWTYIELACGTHQKPNIGSQLHLESTLILSTFRAMIFVNCLTASSIGFFCSILTVLSPYRYFYPCFNCNLDCLSALKSRKANPCSQSNPSPTPQTTFHASFHLPETRTNARSNRKTQSQISPLQSSLKFTKPMTNPQAVFFLLLPDFSFPPVFLLSTFFFRLSTLF